MPEVALRFAVFGPDGKSTDIWKAWINRGSGKRDVYMTSRSLGYAMKLSLHERGQWHVGFHSDKRDVLFDPGRVPASRFLGRWNASERVDGIPICLAVRVLFPWSSPTITQKNLPADLLRIPSASNYHAVEVALFLLDADEHPDTWPGQRSMGTMLLGRIPLDGGGGATLVYRNVEMPQNLPNQQGALRYFAGKSPQDLTSANRIVVWGQGEDASIWFMEAPFEVHESYGERK